jgi:UDP-GlcNAc:undecaprenyl-phosphate/decaprenyl-phosphate GlcNAc-1-phosphate transferase
VLILSTSFLVAVFASLAITPAVLRLASAYDLLDVPVDARRMHKVPVPRVGGIAVFLAMIIALIVSATAGELPILEAGSHPSFLGGIIVGGTIMFLAGLYDDLRGMPPLAKLGIQSLAAAVAFALGFRIEVIGIGSSEIALGAIALPVTILWVVGVTNAFNLIDGLDGLATGIAIVALATTLAVALALGNGEIALVCAALLGALLGFLRYNFNPARIFLGDSGSLFVGFMLAVLSVHGSMKSATAVLVVIPLFVLAIPLLDTTLAIVRRWLRGVPLSGADARHIHHQLLAFGFTHRRAAIILYVVASGLAMLGVLLTFAPPAAVMGIAIAGGVVSIALLLYGMRQLDYHEFLEAGAVLASGVLRMRRIIQDQIEARDLAQLLLQARSSEQLDHILESHTPKFRFLGMELCRESSPCRQRLEGCRTGLARAWKLDYPVTARASVDDDPYVLRIWCGPDQTHRPYGAERVARILAPAVETWLVAAGMVKPVPSRRVPISPKAQPIAPRQDDGEGVLSPLTAAVGAIRRS